MLTLSKAAAFIISSAEKYSASLSDSETLRRQKVFLTLSVFCATVAVLLLIPFALTINPLVTCVSHSCVYFPAILLQLILYSLALLVLLRWKSFKWSRRIFLSTLMFTGLPVVVLAHGGFGHGTPTMAFIGFHMFISLIVYDDITTPAKWMVSACIILLTLGVYELAYDPYANFSYNRIVMVTEQLFWCISGCPVFFLSAWYLMFYLRLEIEHRKKAEALALEESQAKANFLARMSHEIRSPLNGVIGLLELLRQTKLTQVQDNYVKYSTSSAQLLLSVLNDILMFSKLEAGRVQLEQKWFRLPTCLEGSVDAVRGVIEHRATSNSATSDVEIIINYPHDCPMEVCGDEYHLRQVLVNLLNNASKFTASGYIEISVVTPISQQKHSSSPTDRRRLSTEHLVTSAGQDLCSSFENGYQVNSTELVNDHNDPTAAVAVGVEETPRIPTLLFTFKVKDSGIGLSPEQRRKLFDPFVQADVSTTRQYGGTGLGLSICQQIAKLWEGSIHCDSEGLGCGCEFTFTYPMKYRDNSVPEHNRIGEDFNPQPSFSPVSLISQFSSFSPIVSPPLVTRRQYLNCSVVLVDSVPRRASATREILIRFCRSICIISLSKLLAFGSEPTLHLYQPFEGSSSLSMTAQFPPSFSHLVVMLDSGPELHKEKSKQSSVEDSESDSSESGPEEQVTKEYNIDVRHQYLAQVGKGVRKVLCHFPNVKVVAFTKLSEISFTEAAVEISCLPKPVTLAQIENFLKQPNSNSHSHHNPTTYTPSSEISSAIRKPTLGGSSAELPNDFSSVSTSSSTSSPPKVHVLVVDDIAVNKMVLATLLKNCFKMPGFLQRRISIDMADDGLQAITRCGSKYYDIIFMDCHMPNCDGYEATRRIRNLPLYAGKEAEKISIVAVSAATSASDQLNCEECGMNFFLSKPITTVALQDILRAVLKLG